MKKGFLLRVMILLAVLPSVAAFGQSDLNELWEEANHSYTSGDYTAALEVYESIRNEGYVSSKLYYNMGNAYYKENEIGKAILYYNKALRLDPSNEDIRHNLAVANAYTRDRIDTVPEFFLKTWGRQLMYWFSSDTWAVLSLLFFAFALGLILIYLLGNRMAQRKAGFYGAVLCLLLFTGSLIFASVQRRKILRPDEAVIMISAAPVKSEPNNASKDIFVLHEGTKVRVEERMGDWREVVIADGNRGWIESKSIELID